MVLGHDQRVDLDGLEVTSQGQDRVDGGRREGADLALEAVRHAKQPGKKALLSTAGSGLAPLAELDIRQKESQVAVETKAQGVGLVVPVLEVHHECRLEHVGPIGNEGQEGREEQDMGVKNDVRVDLGEICRILPAEGFDVATILRGLAQSDRGLVVGGKHEETECPFVVEIPHEAGGPPVVHNHGLGGVVQSREINAAMQEIRVRYGQTVKAEHVGEVVATLAHSRRHVEQVLGRLFELREDQAACVLVIAGMGQPKLHRLAILVRMLGREVALLRDRVVHRAFLGGDSWGRSRDNLRGRGCGVRGRDNLEEDFLQRINGGAMILIVVIDRVWGCDKVISQGKGACLESRQLVAQALLVPLEGQLDGVVHRSKVLGGPEGPDATARDGGLKKVNATFVDLAPVGILLAEGDGEATGDDRQAIKFCRIGVQDQGPEGRRIGRKVITLEGLADVVGPHGGDILGRILDEHYDIAGNVEGNGFRAEVLGIVGALAHEPGGHSAIGAREMALGEGVDRADRALSPREVNTSPVAAGEGLDALVDRRVDTDELSHELFPLRLLLGGDLDGRRDEETGVGGPIAGAGGGA